MAKQRHITFIIPWLCCCLQRNICAVCTHYRADSEAEAGARPPKVNENAGKFNDCI